MDQIHECYFPEKNGHEISLGLLCTHLKWLHFIIEYSDYHYIINCFGGGTRWYKKHHIYQHCNCVMRNAWRLSYSCFINKWAALKQSSNVIPQNPHISFHAVQSRLLQLQTWEGTLELPASEGVRHRPWPLQLRMPIQLWKFPSQGFVLWPSTLRPREVYLQPFCQWRSASKLIKTRNYLTLCSLSPSRGQPYMWRLWPIR